MLKPETIQNKEFEQSVLGGYRRDEVDAFLDEVEADYRKLYTENEDLVEKLKVCLAKIEDYRKDEEFLKTAIINAQKLNETTLKEIEAREKEVEVSSKARAAAIIAEAEEQAKAILLKAEQESADAVRAAREQCHAEIEAEQARANAEISQIQREIDDEQAKLDHLRSQVSEFKNTIIELYKSHLTSISKLPDFKPDPDKTVTPKPAKAEDPKPEVPEASECQTEESASQPASAAEEPVKPDDNTVEFKLSTKPAETETPQDSKKPPKFEQLKFGVGYDIHTDE